MNVKMTLKRNSPKILTILAAMGTVSTAFATARATPKALLLIREAESQKGEDLTALEKVKAAAVPYIPVILLGSATVMCIFGAQMLNRKETIDMGIKQPRSKKTLYAYVNDAIGFRMSTEVVLYYSDRFFGTADAICFRNNKLRIHDLKTGVGPVHMEQLEVYAALFCLEYKIRPGDIEFELCIYQNDEVVVFNPTAEDILPIMDKIVHLDKILAECDAEEA